MTIIRREVDGQEEFKGSDKECIEYLIHRVETFYPLCFVMDWESSARRNGYIVEREGTR